MRKTLKNFLFSCLTGCMLASGALASDAAYPSRTVSLMVPYPAGGLSDVIARAVNTPLSKALGQTVIVENLGGAGGAIAAQKLMNTPADGHLVFQGSVTETILVPLANAAVKYKADDFRMVQMIGIAPMLLATRADLPVSTPDEFVAHAQKQSAAGKPLSFGSTGYGSLFHVLGGQLSVVVGAPLTHVPYKGGAPLVQDLAAGQIDFMIAPVQQQILGLVDTGRLKILGTLEPAGTRDAPLLSKYPSVNDSARFKDFTFQQWHAYFVRKDTPDAVVQRLNKALGEVLASPGVRTQLEAQGLIVSKPLSPAEATRQYGSEVVRFQQIARNIKLDPQ